MKRGAYLVNTARGKIADRDAVAAALALGPAGGLCRRRLVPAAGAAGPSLADHAASRHDAAHFGHLALGAGALRGGHARDPRMLLRGPADPRRISDRPGRPPRRRRRALLFGRQCHRRLGGSGAVQGLSSQTWHPGTATGISTGSRPASTAPARPIMTTASPPAGALSSTACRGRAHPRPVHRQRRRRPDRGRVGRASKASRSSRSTRPTSIRPPTSRGTPRIYAAIRFMAGTAVEALPFPTRASTRRSANTGSNIRTSRGRIPEAVRMLAPGGRLRLVVHAADGIGRRAAPGGDRRRRSAARRDRPRRARAARCFEACAAVERDGGDRARRPTRPSPPSRTRWSGRRATSRRRTTRPCSRNTGAVLLDTFKRRGHFDLEQLLAKAEQVETEIRAHRGRLVALVEAALDAAGASARRAARAGAPQPALQTARADRLCRRGAFP